jgi:hypothetical protein
LNYCRKIFSNNNDLTNSIHLTSIFLNPKNQAVGNAAARCQSNRTSIASSGILVTLANMMMEEPHVISHAGVEFLQCCILAEQYRYAARFLKGQEGQEIWPSPTSTISVKQVLRYFYLRGMIHLGNDDLELAHRCFWTCLCVPADVSSKIAVEAWKKLVLVQCLLFEPSSPDAAAAASTDFSMSLSKSKSSSSASNIRVPSCMPNCLSRILGTNNKDQHQASIISMMPSSRQAPLSLRHQPAKSSQPEQQQQSSSSGKQPKEDEKINPIDCYTEVFKAFHDRDRDKLEKLEREHMEVWTQDGTLGLLHQVHGALIKCQVLHLAQIYSVVPLSKLATALKVDGGEAQVTRILLQTNVPCEIDDTSMVTFLPKPHKPATLDEIPEWMNLLEMVQKLDVAIGTNPRYLSLMKKEASAAGGDDSAAASGPRGVDDL